jgi:non-specific serine/threonine protein kinase/serine/threonine-protein kinase
MSPRWTRVEELFDAAAELPSSERAAMLDAACAGDPILRREVESLLAHDDPDHPIELAAAAADGGPFGLSPVAPLAAPDHVGPYRIIREIGSGGMGVLYEAVREDQFQKRVAIKIVKRGMDTASIVRRFHRERQILAGLSHPNITALLDGGTTPDGLPYFVMEYVEGRPIAEYCDNHRLSTRQRLDLFRDVCAAVHYAHQNLVVHRDLKPDNILVTADGVPKLLDFGIAKILNLGVTAGAGELTAAIRLMTPEYASPEQVRGEPVTTSTDVYSLGVLLYQLLTGHRPYRLKTRTPQEIAKAICEQEPERPSTAITRETEVSARDGSPVRLTLATVSETRDGRPEQLRKRLRGDVDNIVLKSLHKEPSRRYASVEQFSEDVRRHLDGLPVIAREDTLAYRSGKFAMRHTGGLLAAAAVVVALVGGIVTTARQARIASSERSKAERRFADVRQLANSIVFELHDAIANLPGSTAARELLLQRSLEYLDRLSKDAEGDAALARELASAYERIARVQGAIGEANLGRTRAALESLKKAAAIRERQAATPSSYPRDRQALADVYFALGAMMRTAGDDQGGLAYVRKGVAISEALAAEDPGNLSARIGVAIAHTSLAGALFWVGDHTGVMESRKKALAIYKEAVALRPSDLTYQRNLALGYKYAGGAHISLGQLPEALENYQAALAIDERLALANPTPQSRLDVSFDLGDIGYIYLSQNDPPAALGYYSRVLAIREELMKADPNDARLQDRVAYALGQMGDTLMKLGRSAEAFSRYREMLRLREAVVLSDPDSKNKRDSLAQAYVVYGYALTTRARNEGGNGPRADADFAEALRWYRRAADGGNPRAMADIGFSFRNGEAVPRECVQAMGWFRKSAELGAERGMFGMGSLYEDGCGVPKDYAEAARWYRKAAEAKYPAAMRQLGNLYERGLGVPRDHTEAFRWHRKAADAGDAQAMLALARAYENGTGIPADKNQAAYWRKKAADAGNELAKAELRRVSAAK